MKTKLIVLMLVLGASSMFAAGRFSFGIGVGPGFGYGYGPAYYYAPPPPAYYPRTLTLPLRVSAPQNLRSLTPMDEPECALPPKRETNPTQPGFRPKGW